MEGKQKNKEVKKERNISPEKTTRLVINSKINVRHKNDKIRHKNEILKNIKSVGQ